MYQNNAQCNQNDAHYSMENTSILSSALSANNFIPKLGVDNTTYNPTHYNIPSYPSYQSSAMNMSSISAYFHQNPVVREENFSRDILLQNRYNIGIYDNRNTLQEQSDLSQPVPALSELQPRRNITSQLDMLPPSLSTKSSISTSEDELITPDDIIPKNYLKVNDLFEESLKESFKDTFLHKALTEHSKNLTFDSKTTENQIIACKTVDQSDEEEDKPLKMIKDSCKYKNLDYEIKDTVDNNVKTATSRNSYKSNILESVLTNVYKTKHEDKDLTKASLTTDLTTITKTELPLSTLTLNPLSSSSSTTNLTSDPVSPFPESTLSLTHEIKSESTINVECKLPIEQIEMQPKIKIEVESMSWSESDYYQPFVKDTHGVYIDNVNFNVIDKTSSYGKALEVIKKGKPNQYIFECKYCSVLFQHPKRFIIHFKWHTFGKKVETVSHGKQLESNSQGQFECSDCKRVFRLKKSLKSHQSQVHVVKYTCHVCNEVQSSYEALNQHTAESHGVEGNYKCQECDKIFKFKHALVRHTQTHNAKTLACPECPKMFGSQTLLRIHKSTHEKARNGPTHHCAYCAKSFYENYILQAHERIHRNERPFICTICNSGYATNSSLTRHMKVCHSKKPFSCESCQRTFDSEQSLRTHQTRIHNDMPKFRHHCPNCDETFTSIKGLKKHKFRAHKIKKKRVPKSKCE